MEPEDSFSFESYPLIDAIDHEILMHRDAHFGGKFSIMLDYYKNEGKGFQPDFEISRIESLAAQEEALKQNLAALFLSSAEMVKVADARQAYQTLRSIYEVKKAASPLPRLIADLILSEEEEPVAEIDAVVEQKEKMVPLLLDLLKNENFYDPLFPGYGQAPQLAVKCLGKIGDKRAIISLFESLGHDDFFADDQIILALKAIGKPAEEFLLRIVKGAPINEDNEKAAIALIAFKDEDNVAEECFTLLQKSEVLKDPCLPTYLVLICAGLKDPVSRQAFKVFARNETLPKLLKEDINRIIKEWE